MSIGNTRDEGNKGNNFPWQLKMLLGQQCACDQLTAISSNTDQVEFLLTAILTSLQEGTEYEAKFVLQTCPSEGPPTTRILLEVRVWDTDTSTWGPITYYLPGSDVPEFMDPLCTVEYIDPSGVLAMILSELEGQTIILQDIEADTTSIDVTLTNLFAAYSAGQQSCATSLSVTLCTEQGTTLSGILTELQGTLDVNVTNATLAVTQSGAWTVTSNQGTSPWVVSGTVALDAGTLAALETITVLQGTTPWTVDGTVNAAQSGAWTVALDAPTLAALETITVNQGTSPWVVSGTVGLDAPTLTALENITVQNGAGVAAVNIQDGGNSITVDDGGGSITIDGTVTTIPSGTQDVNIVSGITLEVNLDQNNDQVQVYGSDLIAPIATDTSGHLQVDILTIPEVEIKNDVGNPIPISDAGGSITVDGTIALDASTLTALENITVQNGAGAAAVNIQDGGNSITIDDGGSSLTVDGTVTANQGTSPWVVGDGGGSITVDGTVAATQSGTWNITDITGTISLPTGAATETTLALVNSNTVLGNLTLNGIDTKLTSVVRTPNLLRATGAGTIAPVVYDFSVANVGAANGTILGGTIKPGETLNFSAGTLNNSYAAASIAYDGTGTELVIIYNS